MCKIKSAIVLKDRIFMPKYNSHTKMLEELGITDNIKNASSKFVRVEISPESGDVFTDISDWKYRVDQDILPDWYVAEYDEKRLRVELQKWSDDMNGIYINKKEVGLLTIGDTFKIGNIEYIVLDKTEQGVSCLTTDFINQNKIFDRYSNNFTKSSMFTYLNETYFSALSQIVGEENIIEHEVNLLSYGSCNCKVSLLTVDQYNKYRHLLPDVEAWWWLATPYGNYTSSVCCVDNCGDVYYSYFYYCDDIGVRPFCIFKSSLVVSCA
jgi:hypothetical protein